jgi:hypothetical protein
LNHTETLSVVPASAPRIRSLSWWAFWVWLPFQSLSITSPVARLSTRLAVSVMSWNELRPKFLPVMICPPVRNTPV